jgi:signal transduction histidine kinase
VLHEFLSDHALEIIERTREKAAARAAPGGTLAPVKNGVPVFLDQLLAQLRLATPEGGGIEESATLHGGELRAQGFTVSQVIHSYGDVCQAVTQLAHETDASITASEFKLFNRCLDNAIAHAVTEYQRRRDESAATDGAERLGALAHELRNRLTAAMLSFTILQQGTVGIGGSTGAVLGRSLRGMRDLINHALTGVRLESGVAQHNRVSLAELIQDAEVETNMGAGEGGFVLTVTPVVPDILVEGDQQLLAAALGNLLQNAVKFSHRPSRIALRTSRTADRARIEVEDECGGLPPGDPEGLFNRFEQRSDNRRGLGLGLNISRKAVEAMGGTLEVRDLPGKGCVFTIVLPLLRLRS